MNIMNYKQVRPTWLISVYLLCTQIKHPLGYDKTWQA